MSIVQDGFAFGSPTFHSRAMVAPRTPDIRVYKWFGLAGEAHLTGPPGGRDIAVECFWAAASASVVRGVLQAIEAQSGRLFGDLAVQQTGGEAIVEPQCTFLTVEHEPPRYDPNLGWHASGVLRWRQRVAPVPVGA